MCVLLSHVYLRKKSTIMKSEGRTNIADKDKTRTKEKEQNIVLNKQHHMEIITLKKQEHEHQQK